MFKRNLAAIIATALLSMTAAVQAASSTFPSAAEEGAGYSVNSMLPAAVSGLTGADSVFPSASNEDGVSAEQYVAQSTPRNLEGSYAGGNSNVFPSSAIE